MPFETYYHEIQKEWNIPIVSYKEFRDLLDFLIQMENPPALMVYGPPGIGKTKIIEEFAKRNGCELRKKFLSRTDPADWLGIPELVKEGEDKYTKFIKLEFFKPSDKRLVIFFDELNTATPQVLNSALDIILEKKSENASFPQDTLIVAAGNLGEKDGTFVQELSTATKTRLIQVILKADVEGWLNWAKYEGKIVKIVWKFIEDYDDPNVLLGVDGMRERVYQVPTPRGWERVSNYIKYLLKDEFKETYLLKSFSQKIKEFLFNKKYKLFKNLVYGTIGIKLGDTFIDYIRDYEEKDVLLFHNLSDEKIWKSLSRDPSQFIEFIDTLISLELPFNDYSSTIENVLKAFNKLSKKNESLVISILRGKNQENIKKFVTKCKEEIPEIYDKFKKLLENLEILSGGS